MTNQKSHGQTSHGRITLGSLSIDAELLNFVNDELLAGTKISPDRFWSGFEATLQRLVPRGAELLATRASMQEKIDAWLHSNAGALREFDSGAYTAFLKKIGYIVETGDDFKIDTADADPEITSIAGPQLVVPITNARYALNAANARFGSLYDAFYGTDAISSDGDSDGPGYDPVRGAKVIARVRMLLDEAVPLDGASWTEITGLSVGGTPMANASASPSGGATLIAQIPGGSVSLADPAAFVGHIGNPTSPATIILRNHGLHLLLKIDQGGTIGANDLAGINDVIGESAVSSIMDCEDSIAAVDAADKVLAYRNWLGLMRGTLVEKFDKGGKTITRKLVDDIAYIRSDAAAGQLKARSLMLVRNVGHLMTNPAILLADGSEVPEGIMDAFMTVAGALDDLQGGANAGQNSTTGSVYIVKPKMHGPDEVAFAVEIFAAVEGVLGLSENTIKIGIMDEERRTTVNLAECIRAAKSRVVFINTGFLDRTGDEIHTSMEAGPMIRKTDMKNSVWINAYEDWNVDIGLACGLAGKAQIGKGMWAMPDRMAEMLDQKIVHPMAGATCAWVPSPTAATLHALHYHSVDVAARQSEIAGRAKASLAHARLNDILSIPVAARPNWSANDIRQELRNNGQGILGYVVRWINQGVGCSKVPDIHNIGLMEDRATLRISSQHIANWLHHEVCSPETVMEVMQEMAAVVDQQNEGDADYFPMGPDFGSSIAFQAACDLIFKGKDQPSGYTEPVLHARRLQLKAQAGVS